MSRRVSIELIADYSSIQRGFAQAGRSAKNFDRDLSHTVRGVVSGSGVFRGLGRSLAFASTGFIAFAGVSAAIRDSIDNAERLEKAERGLDAAIRHTGGNLKTLKPQYQAVAESAAKFGVNQADATTALERATVLTGNAVKAQHAYQEALVISKATGKDFNAVLTATSKGQEGVTTSLQRYGILIKKGTPGQEQFNTVMSRFGGQAKANTSEIDKFNATLANTETIIGTTLLPIINKYLKRLGDWLDKMTESGKLQRAVKHDANEVAHAFSIAAGAVQKVDRATGSFMNTLKLLLALKIASYLKGVAAGYDAVAVSAGRAAAAQGGAAAAAGGAAAGAGFLPFGIRRAKTLPERVGEYTGASPPARGLGGPGLAAGGFIVAAAAAGDSGAEMGSTKTITMPNGAQWLVAFAPGGSHAIIYAKFLGFTVASLKKFFMEPGIGSIISLPRGFSPRGIRQSQSAPAAGPFGAAQPLHQFRQQFQLTGLEQLAQAQASLTKTNADDVRAAKQVVARIKKLMDQGRLHGQALIQALGIEASAYSTIWSAEDAAAQKRAQAAARAKARIQAQIQNSIDPLKLEVQLSKDQALGRDTTKDLKALRAAAEKALKSGKLSLEQQKEAWDQIASINQQLADSTAAAVSGFKELNTRQIANKVKGLTREQRKQLRAALSQQGPHHTGPRDGVGAYGYQIGRSGRPIHVHNHVHLDGKEIEHSTTRHQQRRRHRNSHQRRGPNAGG